MLLFAVVTNLDMIGLEEVRSIWTNKQAAEEEAARLTKEESDNNPEDVQEYDISVVVSFESDNPDGLRSALLIA